MNLFRYAENIVFTLFNWILFTMAVMLFDWGGSLTSVDILTTSALLTIAMSDLYLGQGRSFWK